MKRAGLFFAAAAMIWVNPGSAAEGSGIKVETLASGTIHQALFAIDVAGPIGVAVGGGGAAMTSRDAGKTWAPEKVPTELSLLAVDIGIGQSLVVGQGGVILTRSPTGQWEQSTNPDTNRLLAVAQNTKGLAVATGAFGTILKSTDAGKNWSPVAPVWGDLLEPGIDPHICAVTVKDDGVITVAGEFGLILRSADGGAHWKILHKSDATLFAMELRTDGIGYAVGQGGTVLQTRDGGATWADLPHIGESSFLGVRSSADGRVLISGLREMQMSADDGKTWTRVTAGETAISWYQGVAAADGGKTLLAVGHSGQIIRIGG